MRKSSSAAQSQLTPEEIHEVEQACDRFEAGWRAAGSVEPPPRMEDLLGNATGPVLAVLLAALLEVELAYRRQRGEQPALLDYLARMPGQEAVLRREWEGVAASAAASAAPADSTPISLLQRLRRPGEAEAWRRFVELYTPMLLSWAKGLGLRGEDSADLVQEVFTIVVQKLPTFSYDHSKTFRGWLRTIAVNKWRDWRRRKKLPMEPGSHLSDLAVPDDVPAFWEREFHELLLRRAMHVMRTEFQPSTWKACWELVAVGRPAVEIGQELGMSKNAVYVAKYKVIRRLRHELEGLLDDEAPRQDSPPP